jgi:hypothetical protein
MSGGEILERVEVDVRPRLLSRPRKLKVLGRSFSAKRAISWSPALHVELERVWGFIRQFMVYCDGPTWLWHGNGAQVAR